MEFFDNFNFESLYNFHKYFSRLITNFEINKDFFQREKLLNKIFEILNNNNNDNLLNNLEINFNSPQKSIKFFEDKAINKNLKIYFFLEMTILAFLYHYETIENNDLYSALKYCLFYLNQNLLIIMHFIIDKVDNIEKYLKKDLNFEAFYKKKNEQEFFSEKENAFTRNLLAKKYLKLCNEKLNENKTWLDRHFIFKNFNNNNKNLVNVCRNICDIFITKLTRNNDNNEVNDVFYCNNDDNNDNKIEGLMIVYMEIKEILNDTMKIKLEKNLENLNEKVLKNFF